MFTLPELPYAYNALEPHIDEATMQLHHEKHHATYIKNLNDALSGRDDLLNMDIGDLIADLNKVPEDIRTKVRNNAGGHANHSLFWTLMGPNAAGEPEGKVAEAIKLSFGSFNEMKDKFHAAALARFGSGWVWIIKSEDKLQIVDTPNQDSPLMESKKVILALDVWEHAYYLKYKNVRAEYVSAWWNVVDWRKVGDLYVK